jgi:hypothetical protein
MTFLSSISRSINYIRSVMPSTTTQMDIGATAVISSPYPAAIGGVIGVGYLGYKGWQYLHPKERHENHSVEGKVHDVKKQVSLEGRVCEGTLAYRMFEVGKGVFHGVLPHLINMSPMYLSKITNMKVFSVMGFVAGIKFQMQPHKSWLETASAGVLMASNIIGALDIIGLTPLEMNHRIAVDSLLILATAVGSTRAVYEGTSRVFSSWNTEGGSTSSKISDFVSGAILATTGTIGFGMCFNKTLDTITGIGKFQELEPEQRLHVLKNRAVSYLGKEKSCTAVVFDGHFNSPMKMPTGLTEVFYQNCETKVYVVKSPTQFCEALTDARNSFDATLDVVSLEGHANSQLLVLDNDYQFKASSQEMDCLKNVLSSDAQVFLPGCNTATSHSFLTLTERVSKNLPGKDVIGFSAYYNPFFTTTSYIKGRFQHDNHHIMSSKGFVNPITTSVTKRKSIDDGFWSAFW